MNRHTVVSMLIVGLATPVSAQLAAPTGGSGVAATSSAPSRIVEECDYDSCSLRVTLRMTGWALVQGKDSRRIGNLGMFSGANVENLVRTVPEAADQARRFRRSHRQSTAMIWGGVIAAVAGTAIATRDEGNAGGVGLTVAGVTLSAVGSWRFGRSFDHLSQSLWLFNRSLKR
jgi:hypothetical protein